MGHLKKNNNDLKLLEDSSEKLDDTNDIETKINPIDRSISRESNHKLNEYITTERFLAKKSVSSYNSMSKLDS